MWLYFAVYGIPLILLLLIYLRITIYLHQQPTNQSFAVKQRQTRDLLVIRRILIIVGLLTAVGLPSTVLLIMLFITGQENPLFWRITWLSVSLSMFGLSLSIIGFTPQLKRIIMMKFQRNQIEPNSNAWASTVPMRINATTS